MDPLYSQNPDKPIQAPSSFPEKSDPASAMLADHPLRPIVVGWLEKIKKGWEFKWEQFGNDARDCMRFFNGPYKFLYTKEYMKDSPGFSMKEDEGEDALPAPTFQMTLNKVAEGVQLFGPTLYHKNPYRQVNPRELPELPFGLAAMQLQQQMPPGAMPPQGGPPAVANGAPPQAAPPGAPPGQPGQAPMIPPQMMMMQQMEMQLQMEAQMQKTMDIARSSLMQWYLNYTPNELGLKNEFRLAVDEAMIKGAGCLFTEIYKPKGSNQKLVGTFFETIDNVVFDPDAERRMDCKWMARRCCHPRWQVEQEYGLAPGSLKAVAESYDAQATVNADKEDGDYNRKRGMTNDLVVYWKIYSKMGIGARMNGNIPEKFRETLDKFGDYCLIVVAEGCAYPLNVPPDKINAAGPSAEQDIMSRLEWPTPFWMDDAWPCTVIEFHPVPRQLWPMSHFKPAMGMLKFLNWAYSCIASKIRVTMRDFLAIKKAVGQEMISRILHGDDLTLLEIEATHPGTITDIVQFLQHPPFNADIWRVIEAVTANFEKATGLSELMYGESSTQMRSAQEANVKAGQLQIRPDDMAARVEDAASDAAKLEAIAIRWHIGPQDVLPLAGQAFAFYWGQLITAQDPYAMCHQLEYGVEAGSTKKPNKDRDQANVQSLMATPLMQTYIQVWMQSGDPTQINSLIQKWGKANDEDVSGLLFKAFQPMAVAPAPGGDEGGDEGGGEQQPPQAQAA